MGDIHQAVVQILVSTLDGMELAVVDPYIGALLDTLSVCLF